jgi:SAM-dependent methyltransferase
MKTYVRHFASSVMKMVTGCWTLQNFRSHHYLRHNARRLEHLASLRIPVAERTVLEVGAGIGDHSHYFLDRGCKMTITDARSRNLRAMRKRYPHETVLRLDLDDPNAGLLGTFEVVYCYGLLYHVRDPAQVLDFLSRSCSGLLLLETCVSFGEEARIEKVSEARLDPTQAVSGTGCRPTRPWIYQELSRLFQFVYVPRTQPNHEEFPIDWTSPQSHAASLSRAVFIASRQPVVNELLSESLPPFQLRHE